MQNPYAQIFGQIPNSQGGITAGPNQNMSSMFGPTPTEQKIKELSQQKETPKKFTKQDLFGDAKKLMEVKGLDSITALQTTKDYYARKGYVVDGVDLQPEQPEIDTTTFLGKLEQAGRHRMEKTEEIKSSDANFFSKQLQLLGQKAGAFSDIVGAGVIEALSTITPDSIENKVINEVSEFMQTQGVQDTIKTAKEVYDILPDNIQKNVEALGNIGLGILDIVGAGQATKIAKPVVTAGAKSISKKTFLTSGQKAKYISKVSKNLDNALLEISQSKNAKLDIPKFKKAISQIDTKGINTYEDLSGRFTDTIDTIVKKQNSILPTDEIYKLSKLKTVSKGGKITTNYVKKALDDLDELYRKIGDINGQEEILALKSKKTFSVKDVNDIARKYNVEFGAKGFSAKTGEALTSVNAQAYENTRKGVKEVSRSLLPDETMKTLDLELSNLYRARQLSDDMVNAVNNVFKRVKKRDFIGNLAVKATDIIDFMTLGVPSKVGKEMFSRFLLKGGMGKATMDALSLQEELTKSLKVVTNTLKKIDKANDARVISESIIEMGQKLGIPTLIKELDESLKIGDKLDDIADKTGARAKFIDDTKGTGISGKMDVPKELIEEAKKYKSAEEFIKNIKNTKEGNQKIKNLYSVGTVPSNKITFVKEQEYLDEKLVNKIMKDIQDGKKIEPIILEPNRLTSLGNFKIVDGNHRLIASQRLGVDIPVLVENPKFRRLQGFKSGEVEPKVGLDLLESEKGYNTISEYLTTLEQIWQQANK